MTEYNIRASVRENMTNSYRKDLLKRGLIPAVIYGKAVKNLSLEVSEKDVQQAVKNGRNTIVNLTVSGNGGPYKVMIRELHLDPVKRNILHADFQQISMRDKVHTTIPIHLIGKVAGGLARLSLRELEVSCLPTKIPDQFDVDITGMKPGDHISVSDLPLPMGVTLLTEQDKIVVTVLSPDEEAEEPNGTDLLQSEVNNGNGNKPPQ